MKTRIDLSEITGKESGIVIYDNSAIIVCNWTGQYGLPRMMTGFGSDPIFLPEEADVEELEECDDIRKLLPGRYVLSDGEVYAEDMEILSDPNFDVLALFGYSVTFQNGEEGASVNEDENGNLIPTAGRVYKIGEAIVITPNWWD